MMYHVEILMDRGDGEKWYPWCRRGMNVRDPHLPLRVLKGALEANVALVCAHLTAREAEAASTFLNSYGYVTRATPGPCPAAPPWEET